MANIDQQSLDENGKVHGEWLLYHNNGQLYYRGNYVHGVMHGLFRWYHEDGTIWFCGCYNKGIKTGVWYYDFQPKSYFLWLI